jgi:hypothetical protein
MTASDATSGTRTCPERRHSVDRTSPRFKPPHQKDASRPAAHDAHRRVALSPMSASWLGSVIAIEAIVRQDDRPVEWSHGTRPAVAAA